LRFAVTLAALLALQAAAADAPEHLGYERAVELPQRASGMACAVLDAAAFAHAASRSEDDLRLYRENRGTPADGSSGGVETPFALEESEAAPEDAAPAMVKDLKVSGPQVQFDLVMPRRPYSAIDLEIPVRNFIAQTTLTGGEAHGAEHLLSAEALFDLSGQGLPRSTELRMQESQLPVLHVTMHVLQPDGRPTQADSAMVRGALVPPSREAQTLYTTVAGTSETRFEDGRSVAVIDLPAHLPVERVLFVPEPNAPESFTRQVTIEASTQGDGGPTETMQGTIARVDRAAEGAAPGIHYASLTMDATIGANLRAPAVVRVLVAGPPLPLKSVELQMRQRSLCFDATAGGHYVLRYGDVGLDAPVYGEVRGAVSGAPQASSPPTWNAQTAQPVRAELGPEQLNPQFVPRPKMAKAAEEHPAAFWFGLMGILALTGMIATQRALRRGA
jgi:hypothetical protein